MKIENRQQFLVVLTLLAAALLIGDRLIYEPLSRAWSARAAQIRELKTRIREGNLLIRRESDLRRRWNEMRANALPADSAQAEQRLLAALDDWSRASGAQITGILPQWRNDSTNYLTLNCRVEATGPLAALSQFLYHIEKGPMALKVDSAELSARDNTGQQLSLTLQLSGLALPPQTRE